MLKGKKVMSYGVIASMNSIQILSVAELPKSSFPRTGFVDAWAAFDVDRLGSIQSRLIGGEIPSRHGPTARDSLNFAAETFA